MFVLGYRAKKLRQAKLADLIHVSAETSHIDIESCLVEVHCEQIIDHVQSADVSLIIIYRENNLRLLRGVGLWLVGKHGGMVEISTM